MSTPTPEDRLQTVERHCYTIQAMAEVLDGMSNFAHVTNRNDIGFMLGFMAERLRQDADIILSAATAVRRGGSLPPSPAAPRSDC